MEHKEKPKRLLGIDYGMRRFGLALSDERHIIASPLETLLGRKKTEQTIEKLLSFISQIQQNLKCEIEEIIIGLPLMMSGKTGFLADEVRHFVEDSLSLPRFLSKRGMSDSRRFKQNVP